MNRWEDWSAREILMAGLILGAMAMCFAMVWVDRVVNA